MIQTRVISQFQHRCLISNCKYDADDDGVNDDDGDHADDVGGEDDGDSQRHKGAQCCRRL